MIGKTKIEFEFLFPSQMLSTEEKLNFSSYNKIWNTYYKILSKSIIIINRNTHSSMYLKFKS